MARAHYRVVSDRVAAGQILEANGAYHAFWGAGLSIEAGVPVADQICQGIARDQLRLHGFGEDAALDAPEVVAWLSENLSWDRVEERYATCIRVKYPNPADRVDFFRRTLEGIRPSFAHYGAALLMTRGILGGTCLTTNFDKLLENAFAVQGRRECQPLRTASEIQFWRPDPDRCFCIKLHGDYDTHNVLNTSDETVRIDESLRARSQRLLEHQGLVVVGLAGFEKSVYSVLEDLTTEASLRNGVFERGLLWGVYVGSKPSHPWDASETEAAVSKAIAAGGVGPEIVKMMVRLANASVQFAFFPVFGSGRFLMDVIELSGSPALIGEAEPYLDHEMRLRRVFQGAKLSSERVEEHIRSLRRAKPRSSAANDGKTPRVERAFEGVLNDKRVWVAYGDISSRSYLGNADFAGRIRAVVSPDDTYLSVGGGVAVALASKAGLHGTLHEVSKFVPVPHGQSRITSGGFLPVHYIVHAASIEVVEEGYRVTADDVRRTFRDVLHRAAALGVGVLSVPLLGAGVAGLSPDDSFRGLVDAYSEMLSQAVPDTVIFVVYKEALLARASAEQLLRTQFGAALTVSTEVWPTN